MLRRAESVIQTTHMSPHHLSSIPVVRAPVLGPARIDSGAGANKTDVDRNTHEVILRVHRGVHHKRGVCDNVASSEVGPQPTLAGAISQPTQIMCKGTRIMFTIGQQSSTQRVKIQSGGILEIDQAPRGERTVANWNPERDDFGGAGIEIRVVDMSARSRLISAQKMPQRRAAQLPRPSICR